jgi:hypothetical protein
MTDFTDNENFKTFLKIHYSNNEFKPINYTCLRRTSGGKFYIPEYQLEELFKHIKKRKCVCLNQLAMDGKQFNFFLDYDKELLQQNKIDKLFDNIKQIMREIYDIPESFNIEFNKLHNNKHPNKFHCITNLPVMKREYKYIINKINNKTEFKLDSPFSLRMIWSFKPTENKESIDYEKGVYGIDVPKTFDNFQKFSIHTNQQPFNFTQSYKEFLINEEQKRKEQNNFYKNSDVKIIKDGIVGLLKSISASPHLDEYWRWRQIMCLCCNLDIDINEAIKLSKKSEKFDENAINIINNIYENFNPQIPYGGKQGREEGYGIPLLISLVKKSNTKEKATKLINKYIKFRITPFQLDRVKLQHNTQIERIEQRDTGLYEPRLEKCSLLLVKAQMMTFKTQNLKSLFSKFNNILYISYRRSLDNSIYQQFKEFGFENYQNLSANENGIYPSVSRLVCQIDSINKINNNTNYDLVIFDEFVYTLEQLFGNICSHKRDIFEELDLLINKSTKTIILDALLDTESITNIINHFPQKISYVVINNFKPFDEEMKVFCQREEFYKVLEDKVINENKNVVVISNCKGEALKIKETLISKASDKKIKCITKDTPQSEYEIEDWDKYDVVIYTPTIGAGISFNKTHFDYRFGYFINMSASASQSAQMMLRVRNCREKTNFVFFKNMGYDYTILSKDNIKTRINKLVFGEAIDYGYKLDKNRIKIDNDTFYKLSLNYEYEKVKSKKHFQNYFLGMMVSHGFNTSIYKEEEITDDKKNEINNLLEVLTFKLNNEQASAISRSNLLTENEYNRLQNRNDDLTLKEKYEVIKYRLIKYFNITPDMCCPDFVYTRLFIMKSQQKEKLTLLNGGDHKSRDEFLVKLYNKNTSLVENTDISSMSLVASRNKTITKARYINDLLNVMGFDGINDKYMVEINRDKMKDYILNRSNEMNELLGTKILTKTSSNQSFARIATGLLSSFGIKLKSDTHNRTLKYLEIDEYLLNCLNKYDTVLSIQEQRDEIDKETASRIVFFQKQG